MLRFIKRKFKQSSLYTGLFGVIMMMTMMDEEIMRRGSEDVGPRK